jgi:tetratricopeptide (TPR) repeat protein
MDLRTQLQNTLGTTYTLERELSGGGMSRVFVANEPRLNRKIVVKVLSPDLAQGLSAQRFEREIQLAASLQQANIVPVLSAGDTGGLPFYTMPYVEGESLRQRLLAQGALPIGDAIRVLRDVARALAYAHDRGIVHRDIKPDNVLVSGGTAVVTDFGIAKAIAASKGDGETGTGWLTSVGTSVGTPAYISPEQAAGDPNVDHRADLYSFGCMAYELFTGQPPFPSRTPQRMLAAHLGEAPQLITALRPEVPPAAAALVMQCLAKDPAERPQTASEIVSVLDAPTSGSGYDAMPPILFGGRGMLKKALAAYAGAFILVAVMARAAIIGIGLPDWVFPGALVVMALGLPVILFTAYTQYVTRRAILKSPTFTPNGSPSAAQHGTMATIALKASPHLSWRRTTLGGMYAVAAFMLLIGGFMLLRALGIGPAGSLLAAGKIDENERMLVAEFQSRTQDTTLGPVVTEAFRTGLGQSQRVNVMSTTTIRDVLRRMQRPQNSRVDFALAREIATREGLKAVVDGEILGVGGSYTISAKLVSAQTGETLASFTESADDARGVLPAIDRLAKDMRAKIGESLRAVQATTALEQVTTPSLEALRKYVAGSQALQASGNFAQGVALLEEAIAIDTGFAMAYRKLALELTNRGGQTPRVNELLQKAYDHRDRLSDAERYLTAGDYFQSGPKQDITKAIASYEAAINVQPTSAPALNNLGNLYRAMREFPKAEQLYRRAMKANPPVAVVYNNLMTTQSALGQVDSIRATLREYAATVPTHPNVVSYQARFYAMTGQYDSATALLAENIRARASDPAARGEWSVVLADVAELRGRIGDSMKWRAEQRGAAKQRGLRNASIQAVLDTAQLELWYLDHRDHAIALIDAALLRFPLDSLDPVDRPYVRLATLYALAGRPDKARAMQTQFERSRKNITLLGDEATRRMMNGDVAVSERRYADAVREYTAADAGPCPVCVLPALGHALDLAGQTDSSIAVLTKFVSTPYLVRSGPDAQYLAGSHKRLGELWEQKGDAAKAASNYAKFVELWQRADPELQPQVADVKKRLARLGDLEKKR